MRDELDDLLAELEEEELARETSKPDEVKIAGSPKKQVPSRSVGEPLTGGPDRCCCNDPARVQEIMSRLERLRMDLVDPSVREEIHRNLSKTTPEEALTYYSSRPELAEYTLSAELSRMAYRVIAVDGETVLTQADEMRTLYASDASLRAEGQHRGPEVLWRMANQSLFAEALCVVHQVVRKHDEAGSLCLAVGTEEADFLVDLVHCRLHATCLLSLSILAAPEGGRLRLCTVSLSVVAEVSDDGRSCVGFSQSVDALVPDMVFDETLLAAAAALAELNPEDLEAPNEGLFPGFASVRAATALGEVTVSAFDALSTAARGLGAPEEGLVGVGVGAASALGDVTVSVFGAAANASSSMLGAVFSWGTAEKDASNSPPEDVDHFLEWSESTGSQPADVVSTDDTSTSSFGGLFSRITG